MHNIRTPAPSADLPTSIAPNALHNASGFAALMVPAASPGASPLADQNLWLRLRETADREYLEGHQEKARELYRALWLHIPPTHVTAVLERLPAPATAAATGSAAAYLGDLHRVTAARNFGALSGIDCSARSIAQTLQRAIVLYPELPDAYVAMADFMARFPHPQMHDHVVKVLDKALSLRTALPDALFARALHLMHLPDKARSIQTHLLAAHQLRPNEPIFSLVRACQLVQTDGSRSQEAIDAYLASVRPLPHPMYGDTVPYWPGLGTAKMTWDGDGLFAGAQEFIVRTAFGEQTGDAWATLQRALR